MFAISPDWMPNWRRWAAAALVVAVLGAVVAAVHAATLRPAAARGGPAVPASLPGPAGSVGPVPPEPLGVDWLAMHPPPDLGIHADAAVLLDLDTHEVMWARDPHGRRPPASLTKLLTAMVASDLAPSLDQPVTVPVEATQVEADSTVMGLSPGETVTVRELLYGVFLVSGNDAAETLARALTSRERFVQLMNEKAAALGMRDSTFTNPSGLDDPGLRSSAYDLAIATVAVAARYPALLAIAGARDVDLPASDAHKEFFLRTLIKLVSVYPGATGLKSGYTDDAGYCLVGTAARGDRHLAVVLLHSDLALTVDATRLLDYGFGLPPAERLEPGAIPQP
ncbi:MAG TPA: D-alanyl-D-alanine carboxypeptidase family protein [Candidatus Dormibacteraeota bacterium]|nr:D-alanyl-D-alanine carboxypeptidase family protein [Candidatus Dormibacteraeota bacterium]